MNFITLKELKKMVPVASEFKRVPGLKKILEDGIEVVLRKQMENHAEVVVYKNGYVSYHAHERYTVFALHNCTYYYYESQGNEHQTIPHNHFEDIRKILFTSSIAPYGAAEELKTENTLPTPNTPYGISKLVAEKIHQIWQAKDSSRELTIVRPGIVYGKGEHGNMTRLYNGQKKRYFFYAGRKDTVKNKAKKEKNGGN